MHNVLELSHGSQSGEQHEKSRDRKKAAERPVSLPFLLERFPSRERPVVAHRKNTVPDRWTGNGSLVAIVAGTCFVPIYSAGEREYEWLLCQD